MRGHTDENQSRVILMTFDVIAFHERITSHCDPKVTSKHLDQLLTTLEMVFPTVWMITTRKHPWAAQGMRSGFKKNHSHEASKSGERNVTQQPRLAPSLFEANQHKKSTIRRTLGAEERCYIVTCDKSHRYARRVPSASLEAISAFMAWLLDGQLWSPSSTSVHTLLLFSTAEERLEEEDHSLSLRCGLGDERTGDACGDVA